jgi:hypothetical protein
MAVEGVLVQKCVDQFIVCFAHGHGHGQHCVDSYQCMLPAARSLRCALSSRCMPHDVYCTQETVLGQQLRALWVTSYSYAGPTAAQQPAYNLLRKIVADCCKLSYLPPVEASSDSKQQPTAQPTVTEAATADVPAAEPAAVDTLEAGAPAAAATAAEGAPAAAAVESTDQAAPSTGNRVLTRAAAAAGLASCQRQQQQQVAPAAAHAVLAGTPGEHGQHSRTAAGSSHASSSKAASVAAANPDADNNAPLATPQRPAAVSTGQAVPPMGPLPDFAAHNAAATPPAAIAGAASAEHAEAHNGPQQPPSTSGGNASARRCPTRELPPRRAVAVSRYGMLASRGNGSTPARGALPAGDIPSSSKAVSHTGMPAGHHRTGSGSCSGLHPTLPGAVGAGLSGLSADGAGPSSSRVAGVLLGTAGSMTPASPKHAAAGTRGLAALFAGVGHGGAGSSQAGAGSNTGRLLSGLPSLQSKFNLADGADLQRLSEEPAWLWSIQQHDAGMYSSGGKAGPSISNGPGPHILSVPVLRSARRAAAAAAGSSGLSQHDGMHKAHDRQGVHTRSSSGGGGNGDGTSSHWQSVPSNAARSSHHPSHD